MKLARHCASKNGFRTKYIVWFWSGERFFSNEIVRSLLTMDVKLYTGIIII
jgi:hypothetical protein